MLAFVVVASWLSALGWLVRREYFPAPGQARPEAVATFPPSAAFYAVWGRDRQIGIVSTTADTLEDGIRVTARQDIDLPLGEGTRRAIFSTNGVYASDLRLRDFSSRLSGETGSYLLDGVVEGDSLLLLSLTSGTEDASEAFRVPLAGPLLLPEAVPLWFALQGPMAVGRTAEVDVFDPAGLAIRRHQLVVAAESILVVPDSAELDTGSTLWVPASLDTLKAWRLDIRPAASGLPSRVWVDAGGYVVEARSPLGVRIERSAFEIVRGNYRARRTAAGLADAGAPFRTPPPRPLEERDDGTAGDSPFEFVLGRADTDGWPEFSLEGPGQLQIGSRVRIERSALPRGGLSYRIPYRDSTVWSSLGTHVLASADPRVEARARRILTGTRDASAAVEALARWVSRNLQLAPHGGGRAPQGAGSTLERGEGDVNDIVLTFVALAGTAGIPARPVAGILQTEQRAHYHAWAEVYISGWIPVDPVYGQVPADAHRLRLTVDGLGRPLELVPQVTRLRPQVGPGGPPR